LPYAEGDRLANAWRPLDGDASDGFARTLGVLELLAAVGLILPAALDVAPVILPVTAACWVLLMVGAMRTSASTSSA
jgi:hypothetical protein